MAKPGGWSSISRSSSKTSRTSLTLSGGQEETLTGDKSWSTDIFCDTQSNERSASWWEPRGPSEHRVDGATDDEAPSPFGREGKDAVMEMRRQLKRRGVRVPPASCAVPSVPVATPTTIHGATGRTAAGRARDPASPVSHRPFRRTRASGAVGEHFATGVSDPGSARLPSPVERNEPGKDLTVNPTRSTRPAACRPCRRDWWPRPACQATRAQEGHS